MSVLAAVPVALVAAAAYGAASALQAAEAARLAVLEPGSSGLRALARRPLWLLGVVADIIGLSLHVFALTLGPASLVQPLQVTGLLLALPLARYLRANRTQVRAPEWRNYFDAELVGALLLVAGLAIFLAGTRPRTATVSLGFMGIAAMIMTGFVIQLTASLGAGRVDGRWRSLLLGSSAGASFAITSVLVDSLARQRRLGGWSTLLHLSAVLSILGAVAIGIGALALSQRAFQSGPLGQSLPAITVVDPLVAVVLGGALLRETPHIAFVNLLLDAAALVVLGFAVHALAHPREPRSQREASRPRGHRGRGAPIRGKTRRAVDTARVGAGYGPFTSHRRRSNRARGQW